MHGQQLDGRHADTVKMVQKTGVRQGSTRASNGFRQVLAHHRHTAYVGFVDDGFWPRHMRAPALAPVEYVARYDAFWNERRRIAPVDCQIGSRVPNSITEKRIAPLYGP